MAQLEILEREYQKLNKVRVVWLADGTQLEIPALSHKMQAIVVDGNVSALRFYTSMPIPVSYKENLNFDLNNLENIISKLNQPPEQKIYNPKQYTFDYAFAQR